MPNEHSKFSDGVVVSTRLSDVTTRALDVEIARIRSADPKASVSRAALIRAAVEGTFGGGQGANTVRHRSRQ